MIAKRRGASAPIQLGLLLLLASLPPLAMAGGSFSAPAGAQPPAEKPLPGVSPKLTCSSANLEIVCTGVNDLGSLCTSDRDNTGTGQEQYQFIAIDGAGNVIHTFTNSVPLAFSAPIGSFTWNVTAPLFNPIRLRFISLAGNSLPEQVVLDIVGTCPGLPIGPLGLPPPRPVDAVGWPALGVLLSVLALTALLAVRRR